jgi:hypothetical protein
MNDFLRFYGIPGGCHDNHWPDISGAIRCCQAEVKLIADQTSSAGPLAIKSDEQNLTNAQEIEAAISHEIDISS